MRLSILLTVTRRDDTPTLTLPVGEVTVVIDNDVTGLTGSLRANNALGTDDLSSERSLVLIGVDRNGRLVPIRFGL